MILMVPVLNSVMDYVAITERAVIQWQLLAGILGIITLGLIFRVNQLAHRD